MSSSKDKHYATMLDYHYETFLNVCKTLNYTRAAELMNLSQPAVSNHISYLENHLEKKLFLHKNKKIFLTEEGEFLYEKIIFMENYSNNVLSKIKSMNYTTINIGCTLSISDYIIPSFIVSMFNEKAFRLNVIVENTENILNHLSQGKIDAAFIEGEFNHDTFSSIPYKEASIVGICSPDFELADQEITFKELLSQHLILREEGSGTRSAFESILQNMQMDLSSFKQQSTFGSIDLIKRVVEANIGISFLFDVCIREELKNGTLKQLRFLEPFETKNMNFIYLSENPTTEFILKIKEKFQNQSTIN